MMMIYGKRLAVKKKKTYNSTLIRNLILDAIFPVIKVIEK